VAAALGGAREGGRKEDSDPRLRDVREGPWVLESDLEGKNATLATPAIFVGLVQWCDKVLTE